MANGMRIYNASGQLRVEITDRLTRIVHIQDLPTNSSGSVSVPGFNAAHGGAIAIPGYLEERLTMPPRIWFDGSSIHWATRPWGETYLSHLVVFMFGGQS